MGPSKETHPREYEEAMEAVIRSVKSMDLESNHKALAKFFLQQYEELLAHFKTEDPVEAASKVREELEASENATLNIGITGETGAGKSSFINSLLGVGHEEENAAPTGETETTEKVTPYPHPTNPKVTYWDMPGAGAPGFPLDRYAEQVQFDKYDFFIIIASERFKQSHVELAKEIQRQGKRFYFVRSKVDADLYSAKRRQKPSTYKEEKVLDEIKENCIRSLERENGTSPKVFLLSSFDLEKYDFQELVDTLERDLPSHKRHAFLLSLPNVSPQILHKKKEALKQQIWKLALLCAAASGGLAAIPDLPVQILSVPINVAVLVKVVQNYSKSFGLEDKSLAELARLSGKSVTELKAVIKTPLANDLTVEYVWGFLCQSPLPLASSSAGAIAQGCKLIVDVGKLSGKMLPVIGAVTAGALSYIAVSSALHSFLDAVDKDAKEVRKVVLEEGKKSQ